MLYYVSVHLFKFQDVLSQTSLDNQLVLEQGFPQAGKLFFISLEPYSSWYCSDGWGDADPSFWSGYTGKHAQRVQIKAEIQFAEGGLYPEPLGSYLDR